MADETFRRLDALIAVGLRLARSLEQLEQQPELSLNLDAAVAAAFPRHDVDQRLAAAPKDQKSAEFNSTTPGDADDQGAATSEMQCFISAAAEISASERAPGAEDSEG